MQLYVRDYPPPLFLTHSSSFRWSKYLGSPPLDRSKPFQCDPAWKLGTQWSEFLRAHGASSDLGGDRRCLAPPDSPSLCDAQVGCQSEMWTSALTVLKPWKSLHLAMALLLRSAVNTKTQVAIAKQKAAASVVIAQTLMYPTISPSASPLSTISAVSNKGVSL